MRFHNRINAIKRRMQQLQSKFGSSPINNFSSVKKTGFKPVGLRTNNALTTDPNAITFEKLLASKLDNDKRAPVKTGKTGDVKTPGVSTKAADYAEQIKKACKKYGVDEKFVKAIIQQESGFNPNATSWCGAMGMMQLMPETARSLGVKNAYDPQDNIMGGVKYIKQQLDRFGGDKRKALAAYNAGPGAVQKYGGIPPYRETQNYVKNIMSMYRSMGGS